MGGVADWLESILKARKSEGMRNAEKGIVNIPYPDSEDPQDLDENAAYKEGFYQRRHELGDEFQWRGVK